MAPPEESNEFVGAEAYYAGYRPAYDDAALRYLVDRFDLADARVLDLGCGAGQIAVPLAPRVGEVVGMDPNEEMLRHARERAAATGVENVEWVVGSDADLGDDGDAAGGDGDAAVGDAHVRVGPGGDAIVAGPFGLTTIGRAFHRMDQRRTLSRLATVTESGGGVALLGDAEWLTRGRKDWQDDVYAVAERYVDDLPDRTGPVEYDDPWDELLADHGLGDVAVATFESEREWTVDGVVGYVLSLSFCSPRVLGDDRAAFEADLRERLADRPEETFVEDVTVEVISGRF